MDSMRRNAQKMMPHVMALNKNPTMGMKNDRQPPPAVSKLVAYAKGGMVKSDAKQDKSMLARHNKLMHPGQKSKLKNGGMVSKYAEGGPVLSPSDKKKAKKGVNPFPGRSGDMGMKKGGKVKAKGDKKKVMGTVGEAKAVMAALQKARRPATPMPGTPMAGLGMAPPMAPQMTPPMKHGGKVMKKAAGGAAKLRKKSPMPNKIKMMLYGKGG